MQHGFRFLFARRKPSPRQFLNWLLQRIRLVPGGAEGVSFFLSFLSRCWTGRPIQFFWDGDGWIRWEPGIRLPLGPFFPFGRKWLRSLELNGEEIFRPRRKWWFRHYRPSSGDVIFDVGAGMGEDTWVFSEAVGRQGRVLAFEAHPTTYRFLQAFVRYNHLDNVSLWFGAVCENSGRRKISTGPEDQWQANALLPEASSAELRGHAVPCYRLDDLAVVRGLPKIAFMKMNIEGSEALALLGAKQSLLKIENVCICCHDFLGPTQATKEKVCSLLRASGFDLFFSDPGSPPYERDFVYGQRRPPIHPRA